MEIELEHLKGEAGNIGKPSWRKMLRHLGGLHERCTQPARSPFPFPWESSSPDLPHEFGSWNTVHIILDLQEAQPVQARNQILNYLTLQRLDGFLPGPVYIGAHGPNFSEDLAHPPLWPLAIEDYLRQKPDQAMLEISYTALMLQLDWFRANRRLPEGAYYYKDCMGGFSERGRVGSGRFEVSLGQPYACVDACCQVLLLLKQAALWAARLEKDWQALRTEAEGLESWIREALYSPADGCFYDAHPDAEIRRRDISGIWPLVAGAATQEQALEWIEHNLLAPRRFFTTHPPASLSADHADFAPLPWSGASCNSLGLWAARACLRYGRRDAAKQMLEAGLDATARQFERTGALWEFYHPMGGPAEAIENSRKDHLGHNPLFAMARLWDVL